MLDNRAFGRIAVKTETRKLDPSGPQTNKMTVDLMSFYCNQKIQKLPVENLYSLRAFLLAVF